MTCYRISPVLVDEKSKKIEPMETLKVDRTKLRTKSAYAKELGVTPAAIDKMVKSGRVKTVKIKGAELIYLD